MRIHVPLLESTHRSERCAMQRFKNRLAILCGICCCSLFLAPSAAPQIFSDMDEVIPGIRFKGRGVAFGDYDNDGWIDLLLSEYQYFSLGKKGQVALLHNEGGGQFVEGTVAIQEEISPRWKGGGMLFGDYDNDGDLDLFIPVGSWMSLERGLDMLLRNDRGLFRSATLESGLVDVLPSDTAVWFDYDRDGFLDLYVGHVWGDRAGGSWVRDKLYRNNGDGTFSDRFAEAGFDQQLGPSGGSNGGLAAGDFDSDGWPDLYIGVWGDPENPSFVNHLFLNNGQGEFRDATTPEIGDPGEAYCVAVGDIDNDLDLDIFQATGGHQAQFRSLLLLNLGEGDFLDVTEGVGLTKLVSGTPVFGANLADIDNDGDLDLLIAEPHTLYLNSGDGTFVEATGRSGIEACSIALAFGDCDLDGFLDVVFAADRGDVDNPNAVWRMYHNNGNDNHYLRVELVGTDSNRNGIGARLIATSGELRQMREILGGLGLYQNELVAHFGLGQRTSVNQLEIRWPSGQVDILTDIPVDQKIRVIEGRGTFHAIEPTRWEVAPLDTVVLGLKVDWNLTVRPALFSADATIAQVTVDLSPFGGVERAPLYAVGDGSYRLRDISLPIEGVNALHSLSVMIDQATSLGPYWTRLSRQIAVLPAGDKGVFDERLADGWTVEGLELVTEETGAHQGSRAGHFQGEEKSIGAWSLSLRTAVPVAPFGYAVLRFAFRADAIELPNRPNFTVRLNTGQSVDLLERVDLTSREWQVLELPVEAFEMAEPIDAIKFIGNIGGDFYLDDIRLVAVAPPPSSTAVTEVHTAALPPSFILDQNYPNPFNSATVIRFALPVSGDVDLAIFNLAGQQVATLAQGAREAGTYTVNWDGRDDDGRALASGVYLYRLRTGDGQQVETRKLVLVR
jgi:enediyne biosynthesis protein E4